jgi:hypothetical protein
VRSRLAKRNMASLTTARCWPHTLVRGTTLMRIESASA